jgi:cell division protein FtsB
VISRVLGFALIGAVIFTALCVYELTLQTAAQAARFDQLRGEVQQERARIHDLMRGWR